MTAAQQTLATQQGHGSQQKIPTYLPPDVSSTLTAEPNSIATDSKVPTKRSYRHHPKPDPHAPKRPYSAYVLFSNHIRELLATENFDFPKISRQVGERWQALSAEEKNTWKQQTQGPQNKYKEEMERYRGTAEHSEYKQYADGFQARQASKNGRDGRVAVGRRASSSNKGSANVYSTPRQTSAGTGKTLSDSYGSTAGMVGPQSGMSVAGMLGSPETKVPVQRLRRNSAEEVTEKGERKARSKQACEPCRQKRTNCNEERPACGRCLELNIQCYCSSGKENKEKRYVRSGPIQTKAGC